MVQLQLKRLGILIVLVLTTCISYGQGPPRLRFTQLPQADSIGSILITDSDRNLQFTNNLRYLNSVFSVNSSMSVDTSTLYVDAINNRVGIGTTSPSAKLDVNGDVEIDGKLDLDYGQSVFIGTDAGRIDDGSNNNNIGIGYQSLYSNTSGNNNVGIGYLALYLNSSGSNNFGIGVESLRNNRTGSNNVGIGYLALYLNSSGINNAAIGNEALFANNSGYQNTGIGYRALQNNTGGNQNTGIGSEALNKNRTGYQNTGIGFRALYYNDTGANNAAIGYDAGRFTSTLTNNTDSDNSIFIGWNTKPLADSQTNQIVIGYNAIGLGTNSVVLGNFAIETTRLQGDVGIGTDSPSKKLDVVGDVEIDGKLDLDATGNSIFIGENAGRIDDGGDNRNVGVGYRALYFNTEGNNNAAIGYYALYDNTSGYENMAIGSRALFENNTGYANIAIGSRALQENTTGNFNTAIGQQAGRYIDGGGNNTDSDNSVFIGNNSRPLADAQENQIVIGSTAIGLGSNSVVLGNSAITKTRLQGDVGIGTDSPSADLDVVGDVEVNGNLTVTGTINNEPTYKQISLGEGYASNIREFYYDNSITVHPSNLGYSYAELIKEDLLNEASLILTPTATSVGKLYTQKPLGITDGFDFVRNSTSTRVNSLGLIETVADSVPRIDYTDGEPSLLLEPSRTNLHTYSEDFTNAAWTKPFAGTGSEAVVTANAGVAPDGTTTADRLQFDAGGPPNFSNFSMIRQNVSGLSNPHNVSTSIYLKSFDGSTYTILIYSEAIAVRELVVTSEWQRFDFTDLATTSSSERIQFGCYGLAGKTSDNTADILAWGAQLEEGSYATSYIPTNGSTVTRAADVVELTGAADLIGDSEGTLFVEASVYENDTDTKFISLSDGSSDNRIDVRFKGNGDIQFTVRVGASTVSSITTPYIADTSYKIAAKYANNNFALWVNGVEVGTDNSGSTFASGVLTDINTNDADGSNFFNGNVKQLTVFPTALTDSELEALTQP